MDSLLDKMIVLKLNRHWQAFEWTTPRKALVAMCGGMDGGTPPMLAMDITVGDDGTLQSATPTKWEDWIKLEVRESDMYLTNKQGRFRCPLVLVTPVYDTMPTRKQKFSSLAVQRRDGGICQVSKRKLGPGEGNLGHWVPASKGGPKSFENIIWMDRKINSNQGARTPEEMGWDWVEKPKEPLPIPASFLIDEYRHKQQKPFITR